MSFTLLEILEFDTSVLKKHSSASEKSLESICDFEARIQKIEYTDLVDLDLLGRLDPG